MRVSALSSALQDNPHRIDSLKVLFERLRQDDEINLWPLFWLQYSILMTEANDLTTAESFIRTAYIRADALSGFLTFQIDTYAAKLFLIIEEQNTEETSVARFDEIVERLSRVRSMISDESRRRHAVQILQHVEPFVSARVSAFSNGEKVALVQHLNLLIQELKGIPSEEAISARSRFIVNSLERSIGYILRFDETRKERLKTRGVEEQLA